MTVYHQSIYQNCVDCEPYKESCRNSVQLIELCGKYQKLVLGKNVIELVHKDNSYTNVDRNAFAAFEII